MRPWVRLLMIELSDGRRLEIVDGHVSRFGDCDKDGFAGSVGDACEQINRDLASRPREESQ